MNAEYNFITNFSRLGVPNFALSHSIYTRTPSSMVCYSIIKAERKSDTMEGK